ncbi:MAG: NADH-quinone oxidoreductase subunit J [Verrucomicrobiota bacterium]
MNSIAFVIIGILTLAGALAAAILPKLIHAALCLVMAFIGIAAFYFLLGAEFVGLAQILVYVGAVAVLIVFTILLTRREQEDAHVPVNWGGVLVGVAVFAALMYVLLKTPLPGTPGVEVVTVKQIGLVMMADYVWPLEAIGVLLTAALIGSLILVLEKKA